MSISHRARRSTAAARVSRSGRTSRWHLEAAAALLAAGCSSTITGHPAESLAPTLERALPAPAELQRVLGVPVELDGELKVGGLDVLRDDGDAVTPRDCAGVTHAGYRQTYSGAPLREAVRQIWSTPKGFRDGLSVTISVLDLGSAANAQSWYTTTAARWAHCQGVGVTMQSGGMRFLQAIDQVGDSGGMLTAQIDVRAADDSMTPSANKRALTAKSHFLVDVEVFQTGARPDAANGQAADVARLVDTKLS